MYVIIIGTVVWIWIYDGDLCTSNRSDADGNTGSCYWNELQTHKFSLHHLIVSLGIVANVVTSAYFIMNTRRKEVDGPSPPFPATSDNSDESDNCKSTYRALNMQNKVVLITGANAGIGLETARALYERGATVVLGCRSRERALDAMKSIDPAVKIDDHSSTKKQMHFLPLDLTSVSSVRKAAALFNEMQLPLHVLINNAGVMRQKREETEDGIEMTMAANVSL